MTCCLYLKSVASPTWGSYTKTKHNPKTRPLSDQRLGWGLGLNKWNVCPPKGDRKPSQHPMLLMELLMAPACPLCLPPCQKMKERRSNLPNAPWEPCTDGLVTRLGQCWQDASYACRRRVRGDPDAPGISSAARGVGTETGHGRGGGGGSLAPHWAYACCLRP